MRGEGRGGKGGGESGRGDERRGIRVGLLRGALSSSRMYYCCSSEAVVFS